MKPYSNDFRTKIIETKYKTNQSIKQLADRFQVSYSFVQKLLKRYETTGSVEPSPHGGGKPPKLTSEQREIVLELVKEDNDATLEQLCARLEAKTGIKVSIPTMCRVLPRWELTRKKKTLHAREAPIRTSAKIETGILDNHWRSKTIGFSFY